MNFLILFFKYLLGTLTLELHGEFCERFLNILAANKITFWNVLKKKDKFYIEIYKKDILKIKKLRRKTLVKVKIKNKKGAFKIFRRYKYRYGVLVGGFCVFLILNYMSNRTWLIKVNGNNINSETEILSALNDLGVYCGIKTNKINTDILKQRLILSFDNISWASINKQASVLEVNIKEYENEKPNYQEPSNIVALCDGIISEIKVNIGSCEVKLGQTVKKGQLLVSGIISDSGSNSAVHSTGEIYAFVPENFTTEIEKYNNEKVYLDNEIKKRKLEIFNFNFPLFLNLPNGTCDTVVVSKNISFFKRVLPIKVITTTYKPYKNEVSTVLSNQVLNIAEERLKEKMKNENAKNFEILSCKVTEKEESFVYSAKIRKTINIAQQEILKINDEQ